MSAEARIPLGELEDQRLEFKAAAALEKPEKIAREVVGMLNAGGGVVWVGLRDEGGRAVALEPIAAAETARERLFDFLVDSLSPQPDPKELQIEIVKLDSGDAGLLRLVLNPQSLRRPYAVLRGGCWTFVTRVGARLRPMERTEFLPPPRDAGAGANLRTVREQISKEKNELVAAGEPRLWLRLQPVPSLQLNPGDPVFEELAMDPPRSGNRRFRSFAHSRRPLAVDIDSVSWGVEKSLGVTFEVDGGAIFWAALDVFGLTRDDDDAVEIDSKRFAEYTVSALRIASVVYDDHLTQGGQVLSALVLSGRPYLAMRTGQESPYLPLAGLFVLQEGTVASTALVFSAEEFLDNPDRCGFRLLRRIYQSFGIREEDMPKEFDRKTGRLILPE